MPLRYRLLLLVGVAATVWYAAGDPTNWFLTGAAGLCLGVTYCSWWSWFLDRRFARELNRLADELEARLRKEEDG